MLTRTAARGRDLAGGCDTAKRWAWNCMFESPPLLEAPWNGDPHCLRTRQNGKVINIVINATPKPAAIPRPAAAPNFHPFPHSDLPVVFQRETTTTYSGRRRFTCENFSWYGTPSSNRNARTSCDPNGRDNPDHQPAYPHWAAGSNSTACTWAEWVHQPAPLSSTNPFCDSVKPQLHKLSSPAPRQNGNGACKVGFDLSRPYFRVSGAQLQPSRRQTGRTAGALLLSAVQGSHSPNAVHKRRLLLSVFLPPSLRSGRQRRRPQFRDLQPRTALPATRL